jgi:hypothetical protein
MATKMTAAEKRDQKLKAHKAKMKEVCVPIFDLADKYKQLEDMMAALQPEIQKVQDFAKSHQLMFVPPMIMNHGDVANSNGSDGYGNEYYEEPYGEAHAEEYDDEYY